MMLSAPLTKHFSIDDLISGLVRQYQCERKYGTSIPANGGSTPPQY